MSSKQIPTLSRRELLAMIGTVAGSAVSYRAMASMGLIEESTYNGPVKLEGSPKGASVLILGSGIAGMVSAMELRNAGYKVKVLEYNNRAGGRNWSIRGGDVYTELGGFTQKCEFDKGLYINPGPWRLPYNHHGILDYCRRLGVALEPFVQLNYNAYVHNTQAFDGKPQRYREIAADWSGQVAELFSKVTKQKKLDELMSAHDQEALLESLRSWGALDRNLKYVPGRESSNRRGYEKPPGGGLDAAPIYSKDFIDLPDILHSGLWSAIGTAEAFYHQTSIFQPVGGMGRIGEAFGRELADVIQYNSKVVKIHQDNDKVAVTYVDPKTGGNPRTVTADYCLCTIPLSVLSQIELNVSPQMQAAINAVPYSASVKVGLQFKRRFWEQDEHIYGGITYTDMPIGNIGYPNTDYFKSGKGVVLGAYVHGRNAFEWTAMSPAERVRTAVELGSKIHPQYKDEFENGVAVGWHRVPWTLGCAGSWSEEARAQHYENLCQIDNRFLVAGEHASYIPAWQEGAVTSAIDAITRLHHKVVNS
ncbi:flavin monoamine oxidase family protein [Solimonas marina]|uniref:Tryptophan 2-monooxygenase n=1 Tax=Solimonas marina TaxID=2714601 RepID=A0A969WAL9_9GAMM|nr:flavin monoamine oxidase family protein [Solimonas marina]NKF23876.1 flavin monoamine oxidase family protein [Solimonas marina]